MGGRHGARRHHTGILRRGVWCASLRPPLGVRLFLSLFAVSLRFSLQPSCHLAVAPFSSWSHIGLSPPSRQPTKFQQSSLRLEVLECRKRRTSCFPHMALAPRSVGAASGTDAGRCLAGSLGAARLPTRRRAAMAQPQRLPLLGSRPGAAEIGAPSHRLQHPRGMAVLPTPPRPANTIGRAVANAAPQKCRRRRTVPLSDVRRPAAAGGQ